MPKKDFLFEIGMEEIPAGYIGGAINKLISFFESSLKEAKLDFEKIIPFSTPRRLTIKIISLQSQQKDEIVEKVGPAKAVAYDEKGNLTKAALGFLKGAGATEKDIFIKATPKGDKIAVKKEIKGKETIEILAQIIKDVIPKIPFPKSMKWRSRKLSFARPIRWLLVLFGDKIIELEIEGIKSGNVSYGNRFQKLENPVEIKNINEYEKKLESVFVIPDRNERKAKIEKQLRTLFRNNDEGIILDKNLLETVIDLVEYPTAVVAKFDRKYLELPELVVTSTLSEHQKYFAVKDKNGNITNKFVFISNGDEKYSELIKFGNEKVIKARLEDAEFYFKEDTKKPFVTLVSKLRNKDKTLPLSDDLNDLVSKLKYIPPPDKEDLQASDDLDDYVSFLKFIIFQGDLGTLLDKTYRILKLVKYICEELKFAEEIYQDFFDAAYLCKADLVTMMLGEKEYTKLQGYIGHQYALKSGIKENIALAIEEHYFPRSEKDGLPTGIEGAIVAIADKIDTVCGIIGVDMIPTGSKDPFALRRAANGIVQIIANQNFEINLHKLIDEAFEILEDKLTRTNNNKDIVYDFFKQRVNWLLKQRGIDYDVIESVMHIDHSNIPDLVHRAEALKNFLQRKDFIKLVLGFKRVSNILKEKIAKLLPVKAYDDVLHELVVFGAAIDKFFDDVLVNIEDMKLRQNRYNLLNKIRKLFLQVADISKIVVEGENNK
jgi:glycyl-tRNA synthetase beta chain